MRWEAAFWLAPPAVLIAILWYAWRRYQRMQPRAMLGPIPQDVRNGLIDETPEARGFLREYEAVVEDFERCGHAFQFRQFVDLMACGPFHLTVRATADLLASSQFGRYASDRQLRNELGEITAHNVRLCETRMQRQTMVKVLQRLTRLAGRRSEEAREVWLAELVDDLASTDQRLRAHAAYALACVGTDRQVARADAVAATDPLLRAEFEAGRAEREGNTPVAALSAALPPSTTVPPLPTFAELAQSEVAAGEDAGSGRAAEGVDDEVGDD